MPSGSVTSRSLLVFHRRATAAHHPELVAVHLLPEDVDPSQTAVDEVDGALQSAFAKTAQQKEEIVLVAFKESTEFLATLPPVFPSSFCGLSRRSPSSEIGKYQLYQA